MAVEHLWSHLPLMADASDLSRGWSIAISGLLIVFSALLLISLFIGFLPKALEVVARFWPEVDEVRSERGHPESHMPDEMDVLAAIGFVLHTELQQLKSPPRS